MLFYVFRNFLSSLDPNFSLLSSATVSDSQKVLKVVFARHTIIH